MSRSGDRHALVLGGGGVLGAAYEVGVLAAFEERFGEGSVYRSFDIFVGTSAGSFVAALIGQGVPPGRIYRAFQERDTSLFIRPEEIYSVDWARLAGATMAFARGVVRTVVSSLRRGKFQPFLDILFSGLERLPAGFLRIDPMEKSLRRIFERHGLTNAFCDLQKPILIPAIDLDLGERRVLGASPETDPPISLAVAASSAIPRLFGPVQFGSRFFVDGGVGDTAHLDVALERGVQTVVLINPVVASCLPTSPNSDPAEPRECRPVSSAGLGAIMTQCRKLGIEAAVETALDAARARHPEVDFLLIQPDRQEMAPEGIMTYAVHREVLDQGFRSLEKLNAQTLERLEALMQQMPDREDQRDPAPPGWPERASA